MGGLVRVDRGAAAAAVGSDLVREASRWPSSSPESESESKISFGLSIQNLMYHPFATSGGRKRELARGVKGQKGEDGEMGKGEELDCREGL